MSQQMCEACGRGWTESHTCTKNGNVFVNRTQEHFSDIKYDSALVEVLKNVHLQSERSFVIVAYELGYRRGLLSK